MSDNAEGHSSCVQLESNLHREIQRLQSELEAERGKVRELRRALSLAKDHIHIKDGGTSVAAHNNIARKHKRIAEQALTNTAAPTEAEIRAQRDREIVDWIRGRVKGKHYDAHGPEIAVHEQIANELRQKGKI